MKIAESTKLLAYSTLVYSSNYLIIPFTIVSFLASEVLLVVYYRTIADFDHAKAGTSSYFGDNLGLFWRMLVLILSTYFLVSTLKFFLLNIAILNSTTSLHSTILQKLVRSPVSFFDQTPSGILLNKFSNDLGLLDKSLIFTAKDGMEVPAILLVAFFNLWQIDKSIILPTLIILVLMFLFFLYGRSVILSCKQLQLQNKSPIYNFFSETINGLIQIKINHQRKSKIHEFAKLIDKSTRSTIAFDVSARGFGFYMFLITVPLTAIGMLQGVANYNALNSGLFGVIILYLISINENLQYSSRQIMMTESCMVSAQRILQLQHLTQEAELRTPYDYQIGLKDQAQAALIQSDTHQVWPTNPTIKLKDLSARYRQGLPLVLKGISFDVGVGEKVGIVGRTGAGKSSIIQALFRLFESELGSTYQIDRFDALKIGLHSLRQHISVIPQVPFIFRGTVWQNVDPFLTATEKQVWQALEEAGLSTHIKQLEKQLGTEISNNSDSLSVGQKQLLCLARALLRRNRFLVLDQATSNVDMKTDAFIQRVLRERFRDTTVITIAHRLHTIADYDRVIVMDKGRVAEAGSPFELIRKQGLFFEMVRHTGKQAEIIVKKAQQSHCNSGAK